MNQSRLCDKPLLRGFSSFRGWRNNAQWPGTGRDVWLAGAAAPLGGLRAAGDGLRLPFPVCTRSHLSPTRSHLSALGGCDSATAWGPPATAACLSHSSGGGMAPVEAPADPMSGEDTLPGSLPSLGRREGCSRGL